MLKQRSYFDYEMQHEKLRTKTNYYTKKWVENYAESKKVDAAFRLSFINRDPILLNDSSEKMNKLLNERRIIEQKRKIAFSKERADTWKRYFKRHNLQTLIDN